MMREPKFSIIIPTFNRKEMLQRAVQSVLVQEYKNWELVIVDDGSTDGTIDIVKQYDHEAIFYKYQKNQGRSSARNVGLEMTTGTYICFLDSDDELLPNYLNVFKDLINQKECGIYLTGVRLQNGSEYKSYMPEIEQNEIITQCMEGNFNLMPFCFQKEIVRKKPFQINLFYGEDFQFLIPMIIQHKISTKTIETCIVHQHSERTVNKVFLNVIESYTQMEMSILETIDINRGALEKYMTSNEIEKLRTKKVQDFILGAAKYNLAKAKQINSRQKENRISTIVLTTQKIKGIIQSWMA